MKVHNAADYISVKEIEKLLKLSEEEQRIIAETLGYGNRVIIDKDRRLHISQGAGSVPVAPHTQATWYAYQAAAIAHALVARFAVAGDAVAAIGRELAARAALLLRATIGGGVGAVGR